MNLTQYGRRGLKDSRAWFPAIHLDRRCDGNERAALHFAIGLAGEVGEALNLIKKWHRGDALLDGQLYLDLGKELADCAIYLADLAAILGYDLDAEIEKKREILIDRWGKP